jgi:hypothetical protein
MATLEEQQKLIDTLKFTPRTYSISLWGYGGEKVIGTVDRAVFDYFRHRRLDLSDFAWSYDYAEENNIPEEMHPFPPGSWYECDNLAHVSGVSREAGTIQIADETGTTVFEKSLDDCNGSDDSPGWCCNDEVWVGQEKPGTVVFVGNSNEKGTFFEGEINLTAPFDIELLELHYDEVDGEEIVNSVYYDGEEIENNGGGTNGKSSDFGFFLVKDSNSWDTYRNADSITYEMTDWFPGKVKPVREGVYMVRTAGKNSYTYQAKWTGSKWVNSYVEPEEFDTAEAIKVKEWQGLASDPDVNVEWNPIAELEKIVLELGEQVGADPQELAEINPGSWPFGPAETSEETTVTESKSKWWTVRTYYKKSCEQHEYFTHSDYNGPIVVKDGFRSCTYNVETNDGEFPRFEFTNCPGGSADLDSVDLNSCSGDNIESTELVEMFDGGCWGEWEFPNDMSDEEKERLEEFLSENGSYALEDEEGWTLDETEVWVWGPLEVSDDEGNTRIVCADADGNMIDFVEE